MRTAFVVFAIVALTVPAQAKWVKIGPGPNLDYAQAYCDNQAMMMPQAGFMAFGTPANVGMANLGYGLGVAMRQARFKNNCMVLQGWKNVGGSGTGKSKPMGREK